MILSVCLQTMNLLLSVEGAKFYDDEETKSLLEQVDMFISSCPYFLGAIAFFLISMKCSYWGKWVQEAHWIKKCLIVLWWIAAVLGGFGILSCGLLLMQIIWISLFEFVLDPIVNFSFWIFHWTLFIVGFLIISIGLPFIALAKWGDKIPRKLELLLWFIVSGSLIYVLALFSIAYGKDLHLFPANIQ